MSDDTPDDVKTIQAVLQGRLALRISAIMAFLLMDEEAEESRRGFWTMKEVKDDGSN